MTPLREYIRSYVFGMGVNKMLHKGIAKLHKEEFC